ncbi:Heat shock protein 70 family [Trinorchestia longiramus]|nr:Heat shock protein 70 family [Trinorchestia longiramus]
MTTTVACRGGPSCCPLSWSVGSAASRRPLSRLSTPAVAMGGRPLQWWAGGGVVDRCAPQRRLAVEWGRAAFIFPVVRLMRSLKDTADVRTVSIAPADVRTVSIAPTDVRTVSIAPADVRTVSIAPADVRTVSIAPADANSASSKMSTSDIAIGIDLGTSNSCVGVVRNGQVEIIANELGERLTPSFVAFTDQERLIGNSAKYQHSMNSANTVYEVKRLIGRKYVDESVQRNLNKWTFNVINDGGNPKVKVQYRNAEKIFTPEEISAMVLARMKEIAEIYLRCKVQKAVITVPAYFSDSQRQATIDAGTIAGLEVLKIINEPTAAAIAYGEDTMVSKETNILVFDFGGGTFDVAVLVMKKGNYEVKAVRGDSNLGGGDLDTRLSDVIITEFQKKTGIDVTLDSKAKAKIKAAAETAKVFLSSSVKRRIQVECLSQGRDLDLVVTQNKFELLCADLFDHAMQCVDDAVSDAGMTATDIHDVVLVGGSSRIPKLQKMLLQKFPNKNIKRTINPAEAIAYGAAVQAAMLINDKTVEDICLSDVTPQSLGIAMVGDRLCTIIKRNTKIPAKCTTNQTTVLDFLLRLNFYVYEGENPVASKNNLLGVFVAEGIEIAPKGVPKIDVTFQLDCNGILHATAVDRKTGGVGQITISVNKGRLVKKDIDRMVTEMREVDELENQHRALINASVSLEAAIAKKKELLERKKKLRKISGQGYEEITRVCTEVEDWLYDHGDATMEEFDEKEEELNESFSALLSKFSS